MPHGRQQGELFSFISNDLKKKIVENKSNLWLFSNCPKSCFGIKFEI